jgi:hypothetical protein
MRKADRLDPGECLDHIIVFGEAHLRRILKHYADYYNRTRTHLFWAKDAPAHRPVQHNGRIVVQRRGRYSALRV